MPIYFIQPLLDNGRYVFTCLFDPNDTNVAVCVLLECLSSISKAVFLTHTVPSYFSSTITIQLQDLTQLSTPRDPMDPRAQLASHQVQEAKGQPLQMETCMFLQPYDSSYQYFCQ